MDTTTETPQQHWESRYADRVWSGRVNATTAAIVETLTPGRVLDLGCGEGGDAIWLAEHGWHVTAVDISSTAVARGAEAAAERGVDSRITWVAHDLETWTTTATFDLATASFFHSTVSLARTEILRYVAQRIDVGGHLLIVSHGGPPPWASAEMHAHAERELLTAEQEVAALALNPGEWHVKVAENRQRDAVSPSGDPAKLDDEVVLIQRIG